MHDAMVGVVVMWLTHIIDSFWFDKDTFSEFIYIIRVYTPKIFKIRKHDCLKSIQLPHFVKYMST